MRTFLCCGLAALAIACVACSPPATQPTPAAPTHQAPPDKGPPVLPDYDKMFDPMFATFQRATNPYIRDANARLWVVTAKIEDGDGSVRLREANIAAQECKRNLQAATDNCSQAARSGAEWAAATKQGMEQRYLAATQEWGEADRRTRVLDAQVQILRDVESELETLTKPCGPNYFPTEPKP